jgi:hypothetical protein
MASNPRDLALESLTARREQGQINIARREKEASRNPSAVRYQGFNAAQGQPVTSSGMGGKIKTNGAIQENTQLRKTGSHFTQMPHQKKPSQSQSKTEKSKSGGKIKVLFSIEKDSIIEFYIGGDRKTPTKIFETETEKSVRAQLSNLGTGKNKYIASFVLSEEDDNYRVVYIKSGTKTERVIQANQFSISASGESFWRFQKHIVFGDLITQHETGSYEVYPGLSSSYNYVSSSSWPVLEEGASGFVSFDTINIQPITSEFKYSASHYFYTENSLVSWGLSIDAINRGDGGSIGGSSPPAIKIPIFVTSSQIVDSEYKMNWTHVLGNNPSYSIKSRYILPQIHATDISGKQSIYSIKKSDFNDVTFFNPNESGSFIVANASTEYYSGANKVGSFDDIYWLNNFRYNTYFRTWIEDKIFAVKPGLQGNEQILPINNGAFIGTRWEESETFDATVFPIPKKFKDEESFKIVSAKYHP